MHLNKLPFHDLGIEGIIGPPLPPAKNKKTKQNEKPKPKTQNEIVFGEK